MAELASSRPSKYWSRFLLGNRTVLVVLGILTTLLALPAIFSTLALYDDEGYVMMTLKTYMQGHRLYGETHTQYGPAFYLLTSPLHAVFSWPLSQDGIRTKTLLFWVIAVWLCFFIVKRISHSTVAGFATALLAALQLDKLALEPGHPQEITLLCTLAILWLFAKSMYTSVDAERTGFAASSWLTVGFLAGIVGLVKMNCGVVVAIPLIVVASLQLPWAWRVRWGLMAVVILPALMVAWLARTEVAVSLWALWIGLCAAFLLKSAIPKLNPCRVPSVSPLLASIIGGAIAIVLVLGISIAQGISPSELWLGVIGQHSHFADFFFVPIGCSEPAFIGMGLAIVAIVWKDSKRYQCIAKACFWGWVALSIAMTSLLPLEHGLNPRGAGLLLAWAAPGWIVWLWRNDVASSPKKLFLGLVAILSPLIAFPVSGTQVAIGTLPGLLVIGIYLGEFLVEQAKRSSIRKNTCEEKNSQFSMVRLTNACSVLVLVVSSIAHWSRYVGGQPLNLPGSTWMRLPASFVTEQRAIVDAILRSKASNLVFEGNNHNRFYFWTGLKPLTPANPTFWPLMLFDDEQHRLADAIDRQSRLCVVRVPQYEMLYFEHASSIRERLDARWHETDSVGEWKIGIAE